MADPRGEWRGPGRRPPTPETGETRQVALVPDDPDRLHWGRGFVTGVSLILVLVLLAGAAVLILTGTDWGRERVRRFAQNAINARIHGVAKIGRLSGNLLVGMTVHDFSITDSAGNPFVAVESFSGDYSVLSILRKHIWIDGAVLVRPVIVLDRPPDGSWNWQRIFPRDTTPKPASQQNGWADWMRFTNAKVEQGQLMVRAPWHPSSRLKNAHARDSAAREALGGGGRLVIQRAPHGYQKIVQLDSVTAEIPFLRLSQPGVNYRLIQISALSMIAYPFRPPSAVVRDLKGSFQFTNDSVWWKGALVQMPASKASGDGSYVFDTGDMTMSIHSDPASFADMRWVYPRLPANGRGKADLRLKWRGDLQDYQVTNADITMGDAHGAGEFGITLGDSITIHNTNLRFSGIDTRLLEQFIPHFTSPRRGVFAGRATVSGGEHALTLNTDLTFNDRLAGLSHIIAVGGVGFPRTGLRATNLRVQMLPVQVDMARTWMPTLPISGVITGNATINGTTDRELLVTGNINHRDRGTLSTIDGKARVRLAGATWFDIDVNTRPVSLVEVGRFFPAAGLQGSASGPVRLTGALGALRVDADLRLPDGGRFTTRGTLDLASKEKGYDLTAQLYTLNLRTITTKGPITSLSADAMARGRGFDPETMRSTFAADMSLSRWDSIAVDTVSLRVNIGNGLADIAKLYASGAHTKATVTGSFGLARGRTGDLTYHVDFDSLGAFNRWLPRSPGSTVAIQPRPGVRRRALRRARDDSTRAFRATEVQRMIDGRPGPRLALVAPQAVPADTISGSAHAAGTARGNIYDFNLRGRAGGDSVVVRGNYVRQFKSEYAWQNVRTPNAFLAIGLDADSVSAMGFAFDTLEARLTYKAEGTGHVQVAVLQDEHRQYAAKGDYTLNAAKKELRLADMKFQFDTAFWSMPHPGLIQWGGPGIRVTDFELRNRGKGRIYASGLLPTNGMADFKLDVDNFPVSNIVDIVQTDIDAGGIITLHGNMTGTLASPAFRGTFSLDDGTYNATKVPDMRGRFGYADRELVTHIDALRKNGQPMTTVDGRIPINLAFTGVTGSRLLPLPMSVDAVADSLPLELIPQFTDLVADVHGRAAGKVALRGTLSRPVLVGGFTLDRGSARVVSSGATIESITATIRAANDTVYVDSIVGWAKGPVRVRGTLAVGSWREPSFNMFLISEGAELLNNDIGKVRVDAGLSLAGPFRSAYLSGAVTVTQGVVYAPDPTGRHLIGPGDPALFNVLDTAVVSDRVLFPPASPLLANLRVEIALSVQHNTWVRNREANIEVYTDDPVFVRAEQQAFALTGVVTTDRGEYNFLGKRFQIKRGSAMFIGTPDLNPTLQITGEYSVETATRTPINISVVIGGTLRKPKLALESDAQPPRTQSELLSLLAFGQTSTNLLASGTSSITGMSGADVFNVGATRLASVALGVAADQVEMQAGRAFGTDVFDITPGDVPITNFRIGNVFTQTKFEAGKYINPRTFVSVQTQAYRPGLGIQHRTADGWHFTATMEPRILLREPTLNSPRWRTVQLYGGFIIREWRF